MTMNWAVTINASALQRRSGFVALIVVAFSKISSPQSLSHSTIIHNNGCARYH
jgi:hypothetical protein